MKVTFGTNYCEKSVQQVRKPQVTFELNIILC